MLVLPLLSECLPVVECQFWGKLRGPSQMRKQNDVVLSGKLFVCRTLTHHANTGNSVGHCSLSSIYRFSVNVLVFYCSTCWNTSLVFLPHYRCWFVLFKWKRCNQIVMVGSSIETKTCQLIKVAKHPISQTKINTSKMWQWVWHCCLGKNDGYYSQGAKILALEPCGLSS